MATSERTKHLKKMKNIFKALDIITWVGMAIAVFVIAMIAVNNDDPSSGLPVFSEEFKKLLISLGLTAIIGIVLAIFIKDKMRTAVWMLSLIIMSVCYKTVGMYVTLSIWLIDEYVFAGLYHYYKERLVINKEIDLRE